MATPIPRSRLILFLSLLWLILFLSLHWLIEISNSEKFMTPEFFGKNPNELFVILAIKVESPFIIFIYKPGSIR